MGNDDITFELGADIIVNTDDAITIDTSAWDDSFTTSPTSIYTTTGSYASSVTIDATDYTYSSIIGNLIDPDQVENMCKEYPALTKVWRNFKSVYDMTLQDYKGKKEVGDLND